MLMADRAFHFRYRTTGAGETRTFRGRAGGHPAQEQGTEPAEITGRVTLQRPCLERRRRLRRRHAPGCRRCLDGPGRMGIEVTQAGWDVLHLTRTCRRTKDRDRNRTRRGPSLAPMTIDATVPNVARMYDYYLGGYHNFAADREAAEKILAIFPDTPAAARTNRRFMQRAVRYLTREAGIRQFLDIGAGLPTQGNVHEHTDGRVVYVDNDPVAVAQARSLLEDDERVAVAQADLRDPEALLADPHVAGHLDLGEPVAILLVSILHFVPDEA